MIIIGKNILEIMTNTREEIKMKYKKKRTKANLSLYTMAKQIGVDYNTYKLIDSGKKELDGERLNKFQKAIENATQINLERKQKLNEIREWARNGGLEEKMKKMGFKNQRELSNISGISQNQISYLKTGDRRLNEDTAERIYDYLHDSLNKRVNVVENIKEQIDDEEEELINMGIIEEPTENIDFVTFVDNGNGFEILGKTNEENVKVVEDIRDIKIHELENTVQRLEHQIKMYEKLIERL